MSTPLRRRTPHTSTGTATATTRRSLSPSILPPISAQLGSGEAAASEQQHLLLRTQSSTVDQLNLVSDDDDDNGDPFPDEPSPPLQFTKSYIATERQRQQARRESCCVRFWCFLRETFLARPLATIMGCGASSANGYIEDNDGGEEEFHSRFLEDKMLGEGQFGQVKLVIDMKANNGQGEAMACKLLRKGVTFRDNTLYAPLKPEVLQAECDILKTLAGEHYCLGLEAIYETRSCVYVVTELCRGGELMKYVAQQSELELTDVSRIAFQLLSAVSHCASHKIIHRDIKPENIMFRDSNKGSPLRLIDFGSGVHDSEESKEDTSQNILDKHTTFAGSAFYISPEMFQKTYTSKTDVWSCGATLYVLVAGYPAEALQKSFNIIQKNKDRDLRTLPNMPKEMPDPFISLLDQCLRYKHKSRKTAGQLLQHEFLQLHRQKEQSGLSINDVAAVAASGGKGPTKLQGSVHRHSVFLDYKQFERSLTSLLASNLDDAVIDQLLEKLKVKTTEPTSPPAKGRGKKAAAKEEEETAAASDDKVNETKLKVIAIRDLKKLLISMDQKKCVTLIDSMPNVANYEDNAYHITLLRQYVQEARVQAEAGLPRRRRSRSNSFVGSTSMFKPTENPSEKGSFLNGSVFGRNGSFRGGKKLVRRDSSNGVSV